MLAVTEVNGCALCSYAHARTALESGMDANEIAALLAGEVNAAPDDELPAILFAQHYADNRGKPSLEAWERVRAEYGSREALAILGAIRIIMAGNAYGMPFGSLKNRILGKREGIDARGSLSYELGMLVLLIPFVPVAAAHALFASAAKQPLVG